MATPAALSLARRWLLLAVSTLVIAGVFALVLVIGRVPPLDRLFTDPLFFRRALVVHVDLSLVAWFCCFTAFLWFLLPTRAGAGRGARAALPLAVGGLLLICLAPALPGVEPVLSNYVPVLDHPLHLAGLLIFLLGVGAAFADRRLRLAEEHDDGVSPLPSCVRPGVRAAALAFLIALATLAATAPSIPAGVAAEPRYELLFWGAGHVLQFVSVMAMIVAWGVLLTGALGREPWSRRTAGLLFSLLLLPLLAALPLALSGAATSTYRVGFTRLMQWGLFPAVLTFLALSLRAIRAAARAGRLPAAAWRDPRLLGFAVSAGLALVGFALGAMIRGSNTIVPGHYHASIGAVTAAFMAATWALLEPLGLALHGRRARAATAWQPLLFGVGQLTFALGFALAGAHGAERKSYGAEQAGRTLAESAGLAVMGVGGLIAVAGGLLYLTLFLMAWSRAPRRAPLPTGTLA